MSTLTRSIAIATKEDPYHNKHPLYSVHIYPYFPEAIVTPLPHSDSSVSEFEVLLRAFDTVFGMKSHVKILPYTRREIDTVYSILYSYTKHPTITSFFLSKLTYNQKSMIQSMLSTAMTCPDISKREAERYTYLHDKIDLCLGPYILEAAMEEARDLYTALHNFLNQSYFIRDSRILSVSLDIMKETNHEMISFATIHVGSVVYEIFLCKTSI